MPHESPAYWTRAMVEALPDDGQRYELAYGELLVTPAPARRHARVLMELTWLVAGYVRGHRLGELYASHGVLSWGDDNYFLPDLLLVPASESRTDSWEEVQHPLLVVEVVSPSSARHDRFQKRRRFQEAGVPEYWVVDAEQRHIEVWTPTATFPRVERARLLWHPGGASTPLLLDLPALFPST